MLEIDCPWCGKRAQTQYSYEGDATVKRPDAGDTAAFFDYTYLRDNPSAWHDELWQHIAGCRRFLKVRRHMTTHEIIGTAAPDGDLPKVLATGGKS